MRWFISFLSLLCCTVQAAYVVNNAGRKIRGTEITAQEDGRVTLKTESGQMMTFQKGQYRTAAADRPKELEIAGKLLLQGEGERAVPFLKKVQKNYRYLRWDQEAAQLLADHYYETGQFTAAAAAFQSLDDQTVPQNQQRLREAMMSSGQTEQVLGVLNEDIRTGSREAAAQAYLLRGSLRLENGDAAGARRDWLKVMTFFKAQPEAVRQAEELLKESGL